MDPATERLDPDAATVWELLEGQRARGSAAALLAPGRDPLDFAGLLQQAGEVLAFLNAHGLGRGDRIASALPGGPEAATAFLGVAGAAAFAPLDPSQPEAEFLRHLQGLRPSALLLPEGGLPQARKAARALEIPLLELTPAPGAAGCFSLTTLLPTRPAARPGPAGPEDVALVLHTSGTTGGPKRVPIRQRQLLAMARNTRRAAGLTAEDRCLSFMPLHHLAGLVTAVLSALGAGGSLICPGDFAPQEAFRTLGLLLPTWITAVPTVHQALAEHEDPRAGLVPPRTLRQIRASASPLPEPLLARLEAFYRAPVLESYGMTETQLIACNPPPPRARKPGSVGLPAGPEVRVVDPEGIPLPPGEVGEVVVRGDNVFDGYEEAEEANALAFRDGWFRTGDLGCFDEEGYLFLRGRVKELINRGGQKVSPFEVEGLLREHPAVAEAAVFPAAHPTLGQAVMAAVVARAGAAVGEAALRRHLADRLAAYKVPLRILVVPEIPKGSTGKVARSGLAERWKSDLAAAPPAGPGGEEAGPEAWAEAEATRAALALHPAMLRCAVQPRLDRHGRLHLVAFVVLGEDTPPEALLFFLLRGGSRCLLPTAFVALDAMPRDAEGSLDWARLSAAPVDLGEERGPAETLERILARLWREVLPGGPPSLGEDFFLAGGDSLRAVDLLMRVEAETGAGVPPEAFARDPTLGGLAAALEAAAARDAEVPQVTVQAGDPARLPFWFLHGDFNGGGFHCRRLAALLGEDLPVHTFQPHGLPGQPPITSIAAMADAYLPHLRAVQPAGPYRLAGHCNGAVVAFELARRLEALGETVACLALLSPPGAAQLGRAAGLPPPLPADAEVQRQPLLLRRAILVELYSHALHAYTPAPVRARLDLLVTDEDRELKGPDLGWSGLGGALRIHRLPGDHLSILSDHLEAAAAALAPLLA